MEEGEAKVDHTYQAKHTIMHKDGKGAMGEDRGHFNIEGILKNMRKTHQIRKFKEHKPLGAAAALSKALKAKQK